MRGILSLDILAASLFVAVLVASGMLLLQAKSAALSQSSSLYSAERAAWSESGRLLSSCPANGGLALCRGELVFEQVLDSAALLGLPEGVSVFPAGSVPSRATFHNSTLCVRRLTLLNSQETVLEVCKKV